ncbi:Protein CBG25623 [Caenorhabditis briggsae]|uniref:Protein CBG25623 n=1 Tax=Caenorhabditis briggsae TaxID=6238 RepID=B6IFA8_CAEBR|nr:Protein CBG25623 [Caenorhabditis briggsae]CAR98588.1 Protein CBG25623 [Caenorhabditis briggsae]
MRITTSFNSN